MKLLKTMLTSLNLLDLDGNLSITNAACLGFVIKALAAHATWEILAGLFLVLLNYAHKRTTLASMGTVEPADSKPLADLKAQMDRIQAGHNDVLKVAEDAKKLMSQSNLALGFTRRPAKDA